jgi:hypothetical protein
MFAWVPAALAINGQKTVRDWLSLAQGHKRLDCDGWHCIVLTTRATQDRRRTLIDVCRAGAGSSSNEGDVCYSVATLEDGQPGWVRAMIGFGVSETDGGAGGVISEEWLVRGLSLDVISEVIGEKLSAPPFSFAARRLGAPPVVHLTAIQNNRSSPILSGWREFVAVDVFLYDAAPNQIALTMRATLQVNRQNTAMPPDNSRSSTGSPGRPAARGRLGA